MPTDQHPHLDLTESYHIYATKSDGSAAANSAPESALKNWWDAYPAPVSSPSNLECEEVVDLIRNPELGEKDFVVIDVRRNDHAVSVLPHRRSRVYPKVTID